MYIHDSAKVFKTIKKLLICAVYVFGASVIPLAASPLTVEAAIPGYKGKIAFTSNRDGNSEIYVMDADGSNQVNLSNHPAFEDDPAWSPDGTKIAFRSERSGNQDIWIMNADGSNPVQLTDNPAADVHPAWSPDGQKIVFASNRDGDFELYVFNLVQKSETRLTNFAGHDAFPAWSPDGTKIVFERHTGASYDTMIMNADGSNQVNLVNTPTLNERHPGWSPDGSQLVIQKNQTSNHDIYIMDANGANQSLLTTDAGIDAYPFWSPNGHSIVMASNRTGDYEIYTMDTQGNQLKRLTNAAGNDISPAWQPIPNKPPVLTSHTLSTPINTPLSQDVLTGSTDEEALDPTNLTIHTQPSNGTATIESGKVKYTPNQDYVGPDKLTYQICDSFMLDQKCSTAILSIEVKPLAVISKVGDKVIENGTEKVLAPTNRPTFSGTATPNSTVKVEIHSDPIILTTTADENGNWSITPDQDLPPGDHTVYISATLNGVTTELDSFVLAVQQTVPNTGFDSSIIRASGLILLGGGLLAVFVYRRRMGNYFERVSELFP